MCAHHLLILSSDRSCKITFVMTSSGRSNKDCKVVCKVLPNWISDGERCACFTFKMQRKVSLKASGWVSWYSRRAVKRFNITDLLIVFIDPSCG